MSGDGEHDDKRPSSSCQSLPLGFGQPRMMQVRVKKGLAEDDEAQSGVCYLATVPVGMTVQEIRDMFSAHGQVGRIYLQKEAGSAKRKRRRHYSEGWVEFRDKGLAKRVAASYNNTPVGGKKHSRNFDTLWNVKYLSRFKWLHLTEQLAYERAVNEQRVRKEIVRAKREATFFAEQLEKGKNLRRLEQTVLKKGGLWEKHQRQVDQRKVIQEKKIKQSKAKLTEKKPNDELLDMIFAE